jgi:hypothetical protein
MRIRLEPATPRAGDTVQFIFESSTSVDTDFCCMNVLYVGGTVVFNQFHQNGPCPIPNITGEQRVSYVVPPNGVLAFQLQSSRVNLCHGGMPLPVSANLYASATVLAPGT